MASDIQDAVSWDVVFFGWPSIGEVLEMKSFGWKSKSIVSALLVGGLIINVGCPGSVGFLGLQDYQRDLLIGGLAAAALLSDDGGDDGAGGEPEPGAPGARGADGEQGPAGEDGAAGSQGDQGETGATGPEGPAGPAGPEGSAGEQGPRGADGSDGADGPSFFDIFIDDFFTISGNPNGQLPVQLVEISEPALGAPDSNTGETGAIAYRVAIPETYSAGHDVTMRMFFYRPGADVEGCLVITLDALRLRDGEDVQGYGPRVWIRLESSAKGAARASALDALLGENGVSGTGFVIDIPINTANGLNDPDPLAVADLLAFEIATALQADNLASCHDGGRYEILGVEFFESAAGTAAVAGATILSEAPETCCDQGE